MDPRRKRIPVTMKISAQVPEDVQYMYNPLPNIIIPAMRIKMLRIFRTLAIYLYQQKYLIFTDVYSQIICKYLVDC